MPDKDSMSSGALCQVSKNYSKVNSLFLPLGFDGKLLVMALKKKKKKGKNAKHVADACDSNL